MESEPSTFQVPRARITSRLYNSLVAINFAYLAACSISLRAGVIALLAEAAGIAVRACDTALVLIFVIHIVESSAFSEMDLSPLREKVQQSIDILLLEASRRMYEKPASFFEHIALSSSLGGPKVFEILNRRFIPHILASPFDTWDSVIPAVLTALLSQWLSKLEHSSQNEIFSLTEMCMLLLAHAAGHSLALFRTAATIIMSFAVSHNRRALARATIREAQHVHGVINFQYLSGIMIPLAMIMIEGGWSFADEPSRGFWKDGVETLAPELDLSQLEHHWMALAEAETGGDFGCGRNTCNETILNRAQVSGNFEPNQLAAFSDWLWQRGRLLQFFDLVKDLALRERILDSITEVIGFLRLREHCEYCDRTVVLRDPTASNSVDPTAQPTHSVPASPSLVDSAAPVPDAEDPTSELDAQSEYDVELGLSPPSPPVKMGDTRYTNRSSPSPCRGTKRQTSASSSMIPRPSKRVRRDVDAYFLASETDGGVDTPGAGPSNEVDETWVIGDLPRREGKRKREMRNLEEEQESNETAVAGPSSRIGPFKAIRKTLNKAKRRLQGRSLQT
ncbi:hypothetical protein SISNIDRAFT_536960 [Sistotremastrum niveocremeum HHB9708]|uniref:Uncharacterized protein n=1 Tax=Sistotremastrum niveocremeum HHB9708 TaxID=1314777 RepID=A0A164XW94_9AGAM|nr:hypothetical protein SISNIDRAFT_536960 [Sistotremastrum niveocremeum HHB9708]